jgi:hypothetical protein
MFSEIFEEPKRLNAGDLRHCIAHSIQFASGYRLIRTEPGIYFPGRSAEGIPSLPPFFDGFGFISELAPDQERDLPGCVLQRQYFWPSDVIGALKRTARV